MGSMTSRSWSLGSRTAPTSKELAYSRALPLIERLSFHGAEVSAYDPLLPVEEIGRCCAVAYAWGQPAPFRAIVTQTADKLWERLDFSLFPALEVILDGRNSLREIELPENVRYSGIGVQDATRRRARRPAAPSVGGAEVRIVSVVGTRPQLIKAAALQPVLRATTPRSSSTPASTTTTPWPAASSMSLAWPRPDHSLGIGGGGHGDQTGRMLIALEPLLTDAAPDAVLVYGDTNSTLAGALAAAKLGIPVAHVEAGLRSFDRRMPEEINRVVADHLSRWLFAPTPPRSPTWPPRGSRRVSSRSAI